MKHQDTRQRDATEPGAQPRAASHPDTPYSQLDTTHPLPDVMHPLPDTTHPLPDAMHPLPDASQTHPDTRQLHPDTTHSHPDAMHPLPDASQTPPDPQHRGAPRHDRPDRNVVGRVHSIETFGTMDGPGIRFVLFLQGCALRCRYCHNPDTWDPAAGREMSVEAVLAEIEPYLDYYWQSGGGITISGGEPTLQAPFVAALLREAKRRFYLHTAIDTSGFCDPQHAEACGLLDVVDLALLDLKLMDAARHEDLTSQPNDRILRFARRLSDTGRKMWIRHVLVPGVTDRREDLLALGRFLGTLRGVEKFELLPYHRMGVYKWQQLGIPYTLDGVREPTPQEIERAKRIIEEGRREAVEAGTAGAVR